MKPIELDVLIDDTVPADGWASAEGLSAREKEAQDLRESVSIFLALGGKITEVPVGATALHDDTPTYMVTGKPAPDRSNEIKAADAPSVNKIRRELEANPAITFHKLLVVLSASKFVVKRLLKTHFSDHPSARRLLRDYSKNCSTSEVTAQRLVMVRQWMTEDPGITFEEIRQKLGGVHKEIVYRVLKHGGDYEQLLSVLKKNLKAKSSEPA